MCLILTDFCDIDNGKVVTERSLILKTKKQIRPLTFQAEAAGGWKSPSKSAAASKIRKIGH